MQLSRWKIYYKKQRLIWFTVGLVMLLAVFLPAYLFFHNSGQKLETYNQEYRQLKGEIDKLVSWRQEVRGLHDSLSNLRESANINDVAELQSLLGSILKQEVALSYRLPDANAMNKEGLVHVDFSFEAELPQIREVLLRFLRWYNTEQLIAFSIVEGVDQPLCKISGLLNLGEHDETK